jgi:hypothetical protein
MVPPAGLEPARLFRQGILSPQRLPFRHGGGHAQQVQIPARVGQSGCSTPKQTFTGAPSEQVWRRVLVARGDHTIEFAWMNGMIS